MLRQFLLFLLWFIGNEHNFAKQLAYNIDSLGTPYDYLSIMHYSKNAFGRGKMTIRTKNSTYQNKIGRRIGFSEIDKEQINRMYCSKWHSLIFKLMIYRQFLISWCSSSCCKLYFLLELGSCLWSRKNYI